MHCFKIYSIILSITQNLFLLYLAATASKKAPAVQLSGSKIQSKGKDTKGNSNLKYLKECSHIKYTKFIIIIVVSLVYEQKQSTEIVFTLFISLLHITPAFHYLSFQVPQSGCALIKSASPLASLRRI